MQAQACMVHPTCPLPAARPYSRKKTPSITTIIGVMDKPGLSWGAAKETAIFAIQHQDEWSRLEYDDALERLRKHHRGVWDASALVGTMCHAVAEAWSYGREWEAPDDLDDALFDRMGGYVEGLEAFFADAKPQVIATELVVRGHCDDPADPPNDERTLEPQWPYIGTADWICQIGDDVWLLDIKTTSNLDESKEFYTKEWRLQLGAYRWAEEIVHFHGTEQVAAWPFEECVPRPTRTGIVHMRGNGGYQLIELDTSIERVFPPLRACAEIHQWGLTGGHASPPPVIAMERRP